VHAPDDEVICRLKKFKSSIFERLLSFGVLSPLQHIRRKSEDSGVRGGEGVGGWQKVAPTPNFCQFLIIVTLT